MTGQTDVEAMLATLTVTQRPDPYTFVTGDWPALVPGAAASLVEPEGTTLVVTVAAAEAAGAPVGFEAAWLTVDVHSALDAVGLTAALSGALAAAGIACNVLAGYHHDHLLVPWNRAADAVATLRSLSAAAG